MSQPQKVKVEQAVYNAEGDTVSWIVTLASGQKADLVWRRADFGPTFKINALIPVPLVEEFCQNMIGKEINLVVEPKPASEPANMERMNRKFAEWQEEQQ